MTAAPQQPLFAAQPSYEQQAYAQPPAYNSGYDQQMMFATAPAPTMTAAAPAQTMVAAAPVQTMVAAAPAQTMVAAAPAQTMFAAAPVQMVAAQQPAYASYEQPVTGGSFVTTGQQVLPASQGSFLAIPATQTQYASPPQQQTAPVQQTQTVNKVTVTKRKAKKSKKKGCC